LKWLALVLLAVSSVAEAKTHVLKPKVGHLTYAVRAPAISLKPGDVLESETLWGEWYEKAGGPWPGEVGPIRIDGAEPGDTLVVEILKIRPNRDAAISTSSPLASGPTTRSEEDSRRRYTWQLDRTELTGRIELNHRAAVVPLRPMLGRLAVAPEGAGTFGSHWAGPFGGNMDLSEIREGTTVYLPVFHEGALLYFGDARVSPSEGSTAGSGLETSAEVSFRVQLIKRRPIGWPRLEDAEHLMAVGSAEPLSEALRVAVAELVQWLVAEHGFDKADAQQLAAQVCTVRIANQVESRYTAVAKFPKSLLSPRAPGGGPRGVVLGDIPWTKAEKVLSRDRVVVLPLGAASKEHGPHLPLRNDEILAHYFAKRVLEARPVVLLPALPYGYYPPFLEYPGSVSLSFWTQRDLVAEICRSIARYGPRRFYVLNTGLRPAVPLKATEEMLALEGILLRFTDILRVGKSAEDAVREERFGTHADEIETSMILYMEPSVVRMDKAVADGEKARSGPLTRDPKKEDGHFSPSGVFGDPTLASWQKGERITEAKVRDILSEIDGLASAPIPEGTPHSPLDPPVPP